MREMNGYEAYFLCWQARVLESLLAETNNLICAETVKRVMMSQANNCRLSVEQGYDTTWLLLNCESHALGFSEKLPSMMTYTNWLVPKGAFAVGLDINTPSTRNVCGIRLIKQSPLTVTTGFVRKHRYYLHEVSFSLGETLWGDWMRGWTFVLSRTIKKSNNPAVVVVTADLDCEGSDERIFDIHIMTYPDNPRLRKKSEAKRLVKAIANKLDYIIKDAIDEFNAKLTGYL